LYAVRENHPDFLENGRHITFPAARNRVEGMLVEQAVGSPCPVDVLATREIEEIAMCASTRLLAGLVGLVLCLVCLDRVPSLEWLAGRSGVGILSAGTEHQRGALLSYCQAVYPQRIEAKHRVARQVVAGELTLFEAAAWFRFLNETPAGCTAGCSSVPGQCENEKACRQVISWAKEELWEMGLRERAIDLSDLLTKQLEAHRAENGRVILPEL
jgi:hypothetical protein